MALPDVGHIAAVSRDGNDTTCWYWEEGDSSVSELWSIGSATAYRGVGCSIDRMRGLMYYGYGPGTAGTNSLGIFELSDGSTVGVSTSATYDNYHCTFVHLCTDMCTSQRPRSLPSHAQVPTKRSNMN